MSSDRLRLVRYRLEEPSANADEVRIGLWEDDRVVPLESTDPRTTTLQRLSEEPDPASVVRELARPDRAVALESVRLLAPIDSQEVWAAGVTYIRSQAARMEESEAAADCYERVYRSPRPELFFKATPHRVVGPGEPVRVRGDSHWSVPEPEITLVMNSRLELVGFTVGNDMSARDIEGENPLYLPQAKVYLGCCALGPCVTLAETMPPREAMGVRMVIRRNGDSVFEGTTDAGRMARSFEDLIGWLARENAFPHGVFLLTGTGIVPPSDFTLEDGDHVSIEVDGVGELANPVCRGAVEA